jgi:pyruvate dehydrogenase E1 component beta subunit
MARDPRVFLLGEDIARWGTGGGVYGVTRGLVDEFGPERVRDTPVSEEAIVGLAVGAAMMGMRPVAEIMYSDFLTLAMDPIPATRRPSTPSRSRRGSSTFRG